MRFLRHMVRWGGLVALLSLIPYASAQPTTLPEGSSPAAPDIRFTRVEHASGPSHNTINSITQDRQGFLWIGTLDGLNRFDGYTFVVYRHDPADTTSLVSSNVTVVLEDHAGRLWVGTRGGLDRLERARGRFQHYRLGEGMEAAALPVVYQLVEDRAGTVWAGTNRGLFRYDAGQDRFVVHGARQGGTYRLASDLVYGIQEDASGALWVLTGKADGTCCVLYRFDEQASWSQPVAGRTDSFLLVDRADDVWVSATRLGHFDPSLRRFTTPPERLPIENAWEVHEGRNGILWIGSVQGVYRLDPATNELSRHLMNPARAGRLQEQIASLYEDRSGALWVGTYAGLYRYDRQAKPFIRWTHDALDPNSLSSDVVMAVYEDGDGVLWVGTYGGGLNRIDRSQGRVVRYRAQPGRPNSLCDDLVLSIYADRQGTLWLGGDGGTLCSYDRQTNRFTRHLLAPLDGETITGGLWTITGNRHGTLWLGTNSGVYRYTPDTGVARRYPHLTNPATTRDWRAAALHLKGDSVLWIGAETGILYRLHVESGRATPYPLVTADGRAVQGSEIWTIHQDTDGALWLGTSAGLSRFDPEEATFRHYFERDGLPGSVVYSILEDEEGRLWLGTNQGLVCFTPQAERFRTYDTKEGVGRTEFNRRAAFLSRRGEMFFGSMNGVLAFFPDAIQDNPYVPPVALTRIQAANREGTSTITPFGLEHLVLSHKDYFFSFEFAALSFTNPERNQYAYRLEGFDEDWVAAGTRRFASYTNIPPGDYLFRVKGSNNDGVWNEEGAALHLTITPPFWHTWWFRLLALAALAGLLLAAYRYRVRRLLERERLHHLAEAKRRSEEEARRLAELDAAKNRFFANVSHEFRTPLTLILGAADQLDDEAPPPALGGVRRNARRLLRLIDQLLALSKLEAGKLELQPQPGDLAALLRGLVLHFTPLAERKQVALSFHTDLDRLPAAFDAEKVTTIVSNLLSNALKFTPEGGKVMVTLDRRVVRDGLVAEIVVKDTGPGIPKEARSRIFDRFEQVSEGTRSEPPGTGIGLALAKELAELHGGMILVDSEAGLGSVFTARLRLTAETDPGSHAETTLEADVGLNEPEPAPPETNHVRAAGASTLLIVEDNAEVRALLRGYLEPEYQVIEAADGEAGLAAAHTHQPDLVLSDVMMPRMDGVALCNALKADAALCTTPVVLLTAKASDEAAVEGLKAGADDYVTKPFHAGVLRAKLATLVAARQQMRTRFSKELVVKPADVVVPSEEEAFLEQILSVTEERLGDTAFDVGVLAQHVGLSRRQVERRLKKVTGQTPGELIRQMRLERAAHLLKADYGSVSEIAYAVGYKSASHFSTAFREAFGHSPSEHFDKAS